MVIGDDKWGTSENVMRKDRGRSGPNFGQTTIVGKGGYAVCFFCDWKDITDLKLLNLDLYCQ